MGKSLKPSGCQDSWGPHPANAAPALGDGRKVLVAPRWGGWTPVRRRCRILWKGERLGCGCQGSGLAAEEGEKG